MAKHVVSTSFVVMYGLLAFYVLLQLVLAFKAKHKKTGYKAFFLYFSLAWAALRSMFWLTFATDVVLPDAAFYLLFWWPQCIQFATFALLAVFLAKVCVRRLWGDVYKQRIFGAYGISAGFYFVGTTVVSILAATRYPDWWGNVQSLGSAILFLLLAAVFLTLAWKLCALPSWEYNRMFLFQPRVISSVTAIISGVFASRGIFNFLSYAGVAVINIDRDDVVTDLSAAAVYFVWEFFPIILLLSTIAAGPKGLMKGWNPWKWKLGKRRGGGNGDGSGEHRGMLGGDFSVNGDDADASTPNFGVFSAISAAEKSHHNDNVSNGGPVDVYAELSDSDNRSGANSNVGTLNKQAGLGLLKAAASLRDMFGGKRGTNNADQTHDGQEDSVHGGAYATPRKAMDPQTAGLRGIGASGGLVASRFASPFKAAGGSGGAGFAGLGAPGGLQAGFGSGYGRGFGGQQHHVPASPGLGPIPETGVSLPNVSNLPYHAIPAGGAQGRGGGGGGVGYRGFGPPLASQSTGQGLDSMGNSASMHQMMMHGNSNASNPNFAQFDRSNGSTGGLLDSSSSGDRLYDGYPSYDGGGGNGYPSQGSRMNLSGLMMNAQMDGGTAYAGGGGARTANMQPQLVQQQQAAVLATQRVLPGAGIVRLVGPDGREVRMQVPPQQLAMMHLQPSLRPLATVQQQPQQVDGVGGANMGVFGLGLDLPSSYSSQPGVLMGGGGALEYWGQSNSTQQGQPVPVFANGYVNAQQPQLPPAGAAVMQLSQPLPVGIAVGSYGQQRPPLGLASTAAGGGPAVPGQSYGQQRGLYRANGQSSESLNQSQMLPLK